MSGRSAYFICFHIFLTKTTPFSPNVGERNPERFWWFGCFEGSKPPSLGHFAYSWVGFGPFGKLVGAKASKGRFPVGALGSIKFVLYRSFGM